MQEELSYLDTEDGEVMDDRLCLDTSAGQTSFLSTC